ncbi:transglycosylase SLT domain-containing protein [Parvibaculum sedimenti]|uniref:Transglycosylase SLT domain-containing protein n=3 Tax=Parvibaculum sedimenti TaxID=2608632 RepID=A0A6N6VLR8_9HYPH|nr:transglycosylase SLT domain-containing protein [Parvibaculum sedimenti]
MNTGVSQNDAVSRESEAAMRGKYGRRLAGVAVLVFGCLVAISALPTVVAAGTLGTLSLREAAPRPAADPQPASALIWSPEVLSGGDRERYLKIFAAQKRADWKKADKIAATLSDKRLMPYVLQERYLNPRAKAKYAELKAWMASYSSVPGANKIYALAMKKKPRKAAAPERPTAQRFRQPAHAIYSVDDGADVVNSERFAKVDARIREMVRDEKAADALNYLKSTSARLALTDIEYDKVMERIACSFFIENDNERAYKVANEISDRHARQVPLADWYAGLAAWRMEHYADAARHFERLARSDTVADWSKAAGSFWAARAYLANRQPARVAEMLEAAADTGATFYGLLATRQLGREPRITWVEPKLDRTAYEALIADPAVARAVALAQINRRDLAEQELVRAHGWLDPALDGALIALASTFDLSAVELQVASAANLPPLRPRNGEIAINAGLFPVPDYRPADGFRVDRALFFAFMRQESKFRPDLTSPAGARGLMQIMPGTASHISRDTTLASANKDKLFDPSYNLTLAQQYLETLMNSAEPRGNLFMLTTAYNGGPGNLSRWLDSINFKGDPFLFIESIPAPETRGYIERVLTNFWIYRSRLGQPLHSLDATASGDWPVYDTAESQGGSLSLR